MAATVEAIFVCLAHRLPMRRMSKVLAIADKGLEGCAHAQRGTPRQVLLIDAETLAELDLLPGAIKENIVTRGLDVRQLNRGQRLRIGEALLEATLPCAPCKRMDAIRPGLQKLLRGRRGMLFRVIEGGYIGEGDPVQPQDPGPPSGDSQ